MVYFFQKGVKSDTIHSDKNQVFYLVIPDSLKNEIVLDVENGLLSKLTNDSLVKFTYLIGLRYECGFRLEESKADPQKDKRTTEKVGYYTLINGTTEIPKNKIRILAKIKKTNAVVFEALYWYLP